MTCGARAMTRKTRHVQMWLIVLFGVLLTPGAHGAEAITVTITPRVCLEGSSIRVTVRIDPESGQSRVVNRS